nr:immunoglobulin light chain junction region [Macaca mulatta]
CMQSREFPLTF